MPRRLPYVALAVVLVVGLAAPALAGYQFPFPSHGGSPYDYTQLHITNGDCPPTAGSDLPATFDCKGSFKETNYAARPGEHDYDPNVANNPQELFGVKGPGTNKAWEVTTGRPDTVVSVLDSGILWGETDTVALVDKFYLNRGELPRPCTGAPCSTTIGGTLQDYDVNGDGVFNVVDYANDPRVHDFADDANDWVDPQDLIRIFSDGVDQDGNGYTDDISGWDFFEHDNDAEDDVQYGHGTGEAKDSGSDVGINLTQCPNCMIMPLRVGDSFVADINRFAEAVVYATDNGVSVVQEALGTLNHSGLAQKAVDYAYRRGVLVVASEADEEAGHHNYPAALTHTMVVNSVTNDVSGAPEEIPQTYLAFNNCTNFGGYTWVSIESTSCSSDATGQSSGQAGLLYSAARNAVDQGIITNASDGAGRPLSAEEAKQLFRVAANDIDFSDPATCNPPTPPPCGQANNFEVAGPVVPDSQRFVTTGGWDQITGWGRPSIDRAVHLVMQGRIPPEADISSPRWWESLPTSGSVDVVGRVAAPRAPGYSYRVEWAPGVQPPPYPFQDDWHVAASGNGTSPTEGTLATIDLGQVRAAIDADPPPYSAPPFTDPTSQDHPEKDAFRVRVIVCAGASGCPASSLDPALLTSPDIGIEQRQYFSYQDPTTLAHFPKYLDADGASGPAFEDITGDGVDELIVGDGNGFVHAYRADGSEAPGWPVHTDPIPLPKTGRNGFTRHLVPSTVYSPLLLGSPLVADLNGDGRPEVAVGALDGKLYVWSWKGARRKGFPVTPNPSYSIEPGCQTGAVPFCDDFTQGHDVRDPNNKVQFGFTAMPSAGDLDPAHPGLELVAGALDTHVYAFHADGTPVAGWPVMVGDPTKIASVDQVTHEKTYIDGVGTPADETVGGKIITTPTLGDIDGDGKLDVVVNVNEQYGNETPNWSARDPSIVALTQGLEAAGALNTGNVRIYALYGDGTLHAAHDGSDATPNPDDQAYRHGWPAKIGDLDIELLPDVGEGSNGSPVLADVDGDGKLEIATASIASPPYLLRFDGSSFYGSDQDGHAITMSSDQHEFKGSATDGPSVASIGGGAFGSIAGDGGPLSFAMGSTGIKRLLDVALDEQQLGPEDHVSSWNATTGTFDPGFPSVMNDLMFFNTPALADVSGDGMADVLQSSAVYDLRAYSLGGTVPAGWPKFTGGWSVMTPAVGDLNGDGKLDVALGSRDGWLFVWSTDGAACQTTEWPKYQHDLWNTGAYGTDARRPAVLRDVQVSRDGDTITVSWIAPGDDGVCGKADHYIVRVGRHRTAGPPPPAPAGTRQSMTISDPKAHVHRIRLQAVDEVGNKGFPVKVRVP
jgi:Subtilase family